MVWRPIHVADVVGKAHHFIVDRLEDIIWMKEPSILMKLTGNCLRYENDLMPVPKSPSVAAEHGEVGQVGHDAFFF